jgi:hypothetical protein
MTLRLRWGRMLRVAVGSLLALVASLALFVQIGQRILRSRAERLLADMREMQSHPGTWADAQKIMQRWRPWGLGESFCTPEECFFYVRMVDPVDAFLLGTDDRPPRLHWLIWPAQLLGEKFTFIEASLRVNHGIVEESRFRMNFWGQDEGMEREVNTFSIIDSFRAERLQHPDYYAEKYPWCQGCVRFETGFTPFAGQDKIRELTDFDFSCITRWRPCTTEADVMPSAWRIYQEAQPSDDALRNALRECRTPLEPIGRENWGIAIADVLSRQRQKPQGDSKDSSARLRIIRSLKGHMPWPKNKTLTASSESQGEEVFWTGTPDLVAGKRYILFGDVADGSVGENVFWLDECGVVPYNEQNLSAIQRGIDASLARRFPEK